MSEGAIEQASFEYVAEGRANVVFAVNLTHGSELSDTALQALTSIKGPFLLRVPQNRRGTQTFPYEKLDQYRQEEIEPRVGKEHLVPSVLIDISKSVVGRLHEALLQARPDMSEAAFGDKAMLLADMRPRHDQIGFEFKPKWLAQSPMAPANATRCRSCARLALKLHEKKDAQIAFCPLGLVDANREVFRETVRQLQPDWPEHDQERLAHALESSGVLNKLRELQIKGDPGRAMFENPGDPSFGLAMTLRDCACFVLMPKAEQSSQAAQVKLADVDQKNWETKQAYWQKMHRDLEQGGFFTGKEDPPVRTKCLLERGT